MQIMNDMHVSPCAVNHVAGPRIPFEALMLKLDKQNNHYYDGEGLNLISLQATSSSAVSIYA